MGCLGALLCILFCVVLPSPAALQAAAESVGSTGRSAMMVLGTVFLAICWWADAAAPLRALHPDASDASWALRWVAGHPNVHVVLSGMSAEEQLADNLTTFDHFVPLSPAEDAAVEQAAAVLHSRIKIGCTGCRYCMPCPMGVDIPDNFSIWNRLGMFQQPETVKKQWTERFPDSEKALHCVRCGKCETVCPQKLPIRASLARLQEELDAL